MTVHESQTDLQVLVLPITRRDGMATSAVLSRVGLACTVCTDAAALARQIRAGAGAVIVTDAIANLDDLDSITCALSEQSSWSDLPVILLSRTDFQTAATSRLIAALSNVTVLDRPASARTLVSSVQAAIRSRRRQYEIRDQMQVLRAADEALRRADRLKDEFLAMLAHELRNPLAPIRTAAELLTRHMTPESRGQPAVAIIKRQVNQLTHLVDDLLDVSRITHGRIQLQLEPLELSSIIFQALESTEAMARDKQHSVVVTPSGGCPHVQGDRARLVQCVTNLLNNAIKYTDPGGRIVIGVREEGALAVIAVSDSGIGIAPDLLPRIFDPFVQGIRSLDRSEGGLGIGLSVVQRLIEMHGGTVTVASDGANRGSTFELRIPQIDAPAMTAARLPTTAAASQRVLVVDDNIDAASSLAEVLRIDGHVVEIVHTSEGALARLGASAPDIVLLDIGLPGMDGYQVAQKIRESNRTTRLIALTGYGQPEDMERSLAAGFDAHLVKPVDFSVLDRLISKTGVD
jgi:signal transduction histidine kinase